MIATFYSYKGGVGRSMLVANIADWLTSQNAKVLMLDWDLEAPGLENYFYDSADKAAELQKRPGLMDLLTDYRQKFLEVSEAGDVVQAAKICDQACEKLGGIQRYLYPVPIEPSREELLWLIPAGARHKKKEPARVQPAANLEAAQPALLNIDQYLKKLEPAIKSSTTQPPEPRTFDEYAALVQEFDWDVFLQRFQGERFFDWLKRQLFDALKFDIVLIDSRTGVTEMGGVCTRLLADLVICCIAPNQQNIEGSIRMAQSFRRPDVLQRRGGKPEVILAPCRVDDRGEAEEFKRVKTEFDQLERSQTDGRYWFSTRVFRFEEEPISPGAPASASPGLHSPPTTPKYTFWKHYIPYFPKLSYGEALTFPHPAGPARVIELPDMQQKCRRLGAHIVLHAPDNSSLRTKLAAAVEREAPEFVERLALSYLHSNREIPGADLRTRLERAGFRLHPDLDHREGSESVQEITLAILREARALVVLLSPGAAASPFLRQEVREARRMGKCVYTVAPDAGAAQEAKAWPGFGTVYDLDADWERLLKDLRSPCSAQRAPNMTPELPEFYIERPAEQDELRLRLLERSRTPSASRYSICGHAGMGKTQLVARICQDEEILDAFPGGIFWVTLGQNPNFAIALSGIHSALTGQTAPAATDEVATRTVLNERLSGRRFLLVVDDVWDLQHLEHLPAPKGCVILMLTRYASAVPLGTACLTLGPMRPGEALQLLAAGLPVEVPLADLAEALYRWPLLLSLARRTLQKEIARGFGAAETVADMLSRAQRQGPTAFDDAATSESEKVATCLRQTWVALALTPPDVKLLSQFAKNEAPADFRRSSLSARLSNVQLIEGGIAAPPGTLGKVGPAAVEPVEPPADGGFRLVPFFQRYLVNEGLIETAPGAAAATRKFSSAEDHKSNDDVKEVRAALQSRRITCSAEEVQQRIKRLKNANYFDYARNYAALARRIPEFTAQPGLRTFLRQQHALCTYKDPDLPIDQRLDRALDILDQPDAMDPGSRLSLTNDPETLGIAGAIHKTKWKVDGQTRHLEEALSYYRRGYQAGLAKDYGYTGINAAFILDALACREESTGQSEVALERRKEADSIRERILKELPDMQYAEDEKGNDQRWLRNTFWFVATLAEAAFGLGMDSNSLSMEEHPLQVEARFTEARFWLREAEAAKPSDWEYRSTASQFISLAEVRRMDLDPQSEAMRTLRVLLGGDLVTIANLSRGKVGLALSGGGFRASLFHIGVLARLAELDLLKHVEVLSCVSGGSILGAHYYLEVRRQLQKTGTLNRDEAIAIIQDLESRFLAGVQTDLRNTLFSEWTSAFRMLFFPSFSTTRRLGELFEERLYKQVEDGEKDSPRLLPWLIIKPPGVSDDFSPKIDNWRRDAKVPILILNATTLNTGHTWQFTATFMGEPAASINTEIDASDRLRRMYYDQEGVPHVYRSLRLGHAVAASAAVPLLFDPLDLPGLFPDRAVRLSDGGVHDNQGLSSLIEQECSVLLISDASGQMAPKNRPGQGHLSVFYRANEILQERIRWAGFEELEALKTAGVLRNLMFVHLKKDLDVAPVNWVGNDDKPDPPDDPGDKLPEQVVYAPTPYGVLKHVQMMLSALRTDLDSFTRQEAYALMLSGYRMVKREFSTPSLQGLSETGEIPGADWDFQQAAEILENPAADRPLLEIGANVFGKPWKLSRVLRWSVVLTALIAGLEVVWALAAAIGLTRPTLLEASWKALLGVIIAVGAVLLLGAWARWHCRRSPTQTALNLGLCLGGAFVFKFYLKFLAPWYLAKGSLERQERNLAPRRLTALTALLAAALAGVGALLVIRAGNPFSAGSRIQALLRHASKVQPAQALVDYDRAIQLASSSSKQDAELYARRAYLERVQGNLAGALADLNKSIMLRPESVQTLRDRAYVDRGLGNFGAALHDYEVALTFAPKNPQLEQERQYTMSLLPTQETPAAAAPILYIQVADKAMIPKLDSVVRELKKENVSVAPVQVVGAVPNRTQLRFAGQTEKTKANDFVQILSSLGIKAEPEALQPGTGDPNHFELWVGKDDNPLLQVGH